MLIWILVLVSFLTIGCLKRFDLILILDFGFYFDFFLTIGCPRRAACVVAAKAAGIRSTEVDVVVDG